MWSFLYGISDGLRSAYLQLCAVLEAHAIFGCLANKAMVQEPEFAFGCLWHDIIRIHEWAKSETLSIAAAGFFCSATKQLLKNRLAAWRQELLIYLDEHEQVVAITLWTYQIPLSAGKQIHPNRTINSRIEIFRKKQHKVKATKGQVLLQSHQPHCSTWPTCEIAKSRSA